MTTYEYVAVALCAVAIGLMGYGFGWCDGRESMRRKLK